MAYNFPSSSLSNPVTVAQGGTGVGTLTNHGVLLGQATGNVTATAAGSSGQVLQSGGASGNPAYSTATYPATATSTGTVTTNIPTSNPMGIQAQIVKTGGTTNRTILTDYGYMLNTLTAGR